VVRGKAATAAGLLVLTGLLLVVFCCLFEEERVNTGIERCWNDVGTMLKLNKLNVKKKKSIFKNIGV
jgi:hypothetical protein